MSTITTDVAAMALRELPDLMRAKGVQHLSCGELTITLAPEAPAPTDDREPATDEQIADAARRETHAAGGFVPVDLRAFGRGQ